ncbi:NTP transferase domain-containing protein [Streptomyces sp. NPDC047002]|uniref:phosphocholine cytidylyltransferase family protein n=1 Tax=Streptomyces sp. NPDC047002 TaxID=3155475 RepID=UPI003451CAD1
MTAGVLPGRTDPAAVPSGAAAGTARGVTARAVILAAGRGTRLAPLPEARRLPKCLLRYGGTTLLERHLRLLRAVGVTDVVLVVGHLASDITAELAALAPDPAPTVVVNPDYRQGSTVSLHAAADHLAPEGDLLVMDADVLYDLRMLTALTAGGSANRMLADHDFDPGPEPVKICQSGGRVVDLTKDVPEGLAPDRLAESVGFFRLTPAASRELAATTARHVAEGRTGLPHEDVLRELIRSGRVDFEAADVSGLPWCETDFPHDVRHARTHVLPRLEGLPG